MKTLTYSSKITAPKQKVWDTMLSLDTYKEWTGVCWPDSTYEGKWQTGEKLWFIGPEGSGILAKVISLALHEEVVLEHIAILLKGKIEDRDSDMAKAWIGAIEQYNFAETDGITELIVTMKVDPKSEDMFNNDWPKALAKLKEICER